MKSLIEVRKFAVDKAALIMGAGTADKDVISKAKEIEAYIVGNAILPEVYDESNAISGMIGDILGTLPFNERTKTKK